MPLPAIILSLIVAYCVGCIQCAFDEDSAKRTMLFLAAVALITVGYWIAQLAR